MTPRNQYFAEINATLPTANRADLLFARWYRSPHHRGKTRLLRWAHALARKRTVVTRLDTGIVMELNPADYVQREILFHGGYEKQTLQLLDQLLETSAEFWDFGAHMGLYTLQAARALAPSGRRVLAIEPNPAQCLALQRNLLLNGLRNVTLCPVASGDASDLIQLITPDGDNTGGSRLGTYAKGDSRQTRLVVPVLPAATLARAFNLQASTLVKIDTEGREFAILDSLLTVARPTNILIEYFAANHPREEALVRFESYANLGYELRTIDGQPWDRVSALIEHNLWLHWSRG